MKALALRIDGELRATASVSDGMIGFTLICDDEGDYGKGNRLRLGGIDGESHLDWYVTENLRLGTSIQLDFIETDTSDSPIRRPTDPVLAAEVDRERFESAKQVYLALRDMYE